MKTAKNHESNLGGALLENEVFKLLQQMMEGSCVEDTVVISGWKDSNPKAKKEFDFLIVSLPMKAIVHIEVKRTLSEETKKKVVTQLEKGHSVIKGKVPFHAKSDWKYFQYILFSRRETNDDEIDKFLGSKRCSNFSCTSTDLGNWWQELVSERLKVTSASKSKTGDSETYINILKFYFHQMFIQKDVLTQGKDHWLLPDRAPRGELLKGKS